MKKALKIIANIAAWLIVIFALLVTILVFSSTNNNGIPQLFGYIPLTVESQSMSPTFEQGDLIISKQIDDPSTLQVDDVISFWTIIDGVKVKNTHRIVRIENNNGVVSFITRGDNNPIDDEVPTYPADLIGKWTNIRLGGAGNIMNFLRTRLGFFICILIPMALFFLFELYKFIVTVVKVKKGNAGPQLDEEEIKRRAIEEYLAAQKEKDSAGQPSDTSDKKPEDEKADASEKTEAKSDEAKKDKEASEKTEAKSDEAKKDKEASEKTEAKSDEAKKDKEASEKTEAKSDEVKKDKQASEKTEAKSDEVKKDKEASEKTEEKKSDETKKEAASENKEPAAKTDSKKATSEEQTKKQ